MGGFDRFAPHRYKIPNWPFYYHTADPVLSTELRKPES